jgi:hypothetical protein
MTLKEKIEVIYTEDQLRNKDYFDELLHEDFKMEWHSSKGYVTMTKEELMKFVHELKLNYSESSVDMKHILAENNKVSVAYHHFASSIEHPKDLIMIGRLMCVWEFDGDKAIAAYQVSQPE